MKTCSLYIHIPFCARKCPYCGFFSQPGRSAVWDEYFEALRDEITACKDTLKSYLIDTVYVGGGTPSLVPAMLVRDLLKHISSTCRVSPHAETTIEANPESLTKEKLKAYREANIKRLSIGLQAWQDDLLDKLGRSYSAKQFVGVYAMARNAGFSNINIDLMFGLPGQTVAHWKHTLEQVVRLSPEHVSCYSLELDTDSAWVRLHGMGRLEVPKENLDRRMYKEAIGVLKKAGYKQYEVSNWAKSGYECRHNTNIWKYLPYIGIGAGAHSFFDRTRWSNPEHIEKYIIDIKRHSNARENIIHIPTTEAEKEKIMLGLRLTSGINICPANRNQVLKKQNEIQRLKELGLLSKRKGIIRLTRKGLDVENYVISQIL